MLASSPKRCIYKTCPVGSTLNPTRIFQLSPLAICLQETVLNYFMRIPVHSERFPPTLPSRNSLKHWKVKKKKSWVLEINSEQQSIWPLCLGAMEGEMALALKVPGFNIAFSPRVFPRLSGIILQGISCYPQLA